MTFLYVLLAIALLGILITVHEYGHFIAARLTGIAVKEFSIGFGPKLFQWKSKKHETLFSLRPIPMGGYCMFYGDTDDDSDALTLDDPQSYYNTPVWKRMVSIVSGPLMNLLLAFVVSVLFMAMYGSAVTQPYIHSVEAGMPAETAGLMPGDVILQVGDQMLDGASVANVSDAIASAQENAPLSITVERNGQTLSLLSHPVLDEVENRWRIGIMVSGVRELFPGEVLPAAWDSCVFAGGLILDALGKVITTGEGLDQTTGPVGMVRLIAEETRVGGFSIFLNLMIIISINLGLFNLLPIPGLDGSRLVFSLIELVFRKRVSMKVESIIHVFGYALLLGAMLFFTFRDVGKIFGI